MQSHNSKKISFKSLLLKTLQQLLIYKHRYKSRKVLLRLDDHMLNDIGISKDQAQEEAQKPFWKGDSFAFDINEYTRFKKRTFLEKTHKSGGVSLF